MKSITCISDIHGNFFTFLALLSKIPKDHLIVCVGDLCDRGAYSRNVIEFIINQSDRNNSKFNHDYQVIKSVKGNHEVMFGDFVESLKRSISNPFYGHTNMHLFLQNGGDKTILNYSTDPNPNIFTLNYDKLDYKTLNKHIDFINALPIILEFTDVINEENRHLVVSHSSVGKVYNWTEKHKKEQIKHYEENILWGRPNNVKDVKKIYNVFGHTPKAHPVVKNHYANIDTGAFYDKEPDVGYNKLTAISFPSLELYEQTTLVIDKTFHKGNLI